jgi:hypothetical protein
MDGYGSWDLLNNHSLPPLPVPTQECSDPGCDAGAVDLNINGDGKFKLEWFAVPVRRSLKMSA